MKRSAFLFFKGLGLLFAILCGIGTAVLGWFDGADWMNIVTYSIAVTGLILWGWYHFSIRWIHGDLKENILSQFPKKESIEGKDLAEVEQEENFFFKVVREHKWKTLAFILLILIKSVNNFRIDILCQVHGSAQHRLSSIISAQRCVLLPRIPRCYFADATEVIIGRILLLSITSIAQLEHSIATCKQT